MPALAIIHDLVQRVSDSLDHYLSNSYNEAELSDESLEPSFKVLGRDANDKRNFILHYRAVIVEDYLQVDDQTRAPDASSCLTNQRKIFIGTKKSDREQLQGFATVAAFDRLVQYFLGISEEEINAIA